MMFSQVLRRYLEDEPCRDAGKWLRGLMALDALLGVRVAEARQSYAGENGFEWETFRALCCKNIEEDNLAMQQEMVARSFSSSDPSAEQDE